MLALRWPSGHWPLDAGVWTTGPVGRWLPSALVAFGTRRCRLGMVRETRSINRRHPTTDPADGPDDYREFLHEIWVTETVKAPRGRAGAHPVLRIMVGL